MSTTALYSRVFLLAMTAGLLGCAGEPPLAPPKPVEVVVSRPVKENIAEWDVYTGTVEAKDSVEVRARVRGHIKEVSFAKKEGEEIAAGTELFLIDPEPFEAVLKQEKGNLSTWESNLKLADEKIAFYKPLAEKGSISKEELLKVLSDKGEAIGKIDSAKGKITEAELNISYCKITAPIAGRVGESQLSKGDLVNATGAESLLTTIVAVDPMYVYFNVHEGAYERYRELLRAQAEKTSGGSKEKLKIPVQLAVAGQEFSPKSYQGIVDFVDNRIDHATGSIKVRARFDNAKGVDGRRPLTPGLFARVRITLAEPTPAILVADRAILSDQSLKYVLAVNKSDNKVERLDVRASDRLQEDGLRAVEGLKGDEWIISEGVNRARPGVTVAPTEGKMPRRPPPTN